MQLTDHFSLEEMIASETAVRQGINNAPSLAVQKNLVRTCQTLEQVRVLLGSKSISISSGYRCDALNRAIGGAMTSAHSFGLAADFKCPGFGSPLDICRALAASKISFDQLIYEGTWVHLGLAADGAKPRQQILTAVFKTGRPTTYVAGLPQ